MEAIAGTASTTYVLMSSMESALPPHTAINIVTTLSHWIMELNVCVDVATKDDP